jgi:glycosyltransferase involved in cell wall biosynthesis
MTDISASTATGSLLRELFAGFPPSSIFQLTVPRSEDEISERYRNRFTLPAVSPRLGKLRRIWPFSLVFRKSGLRLADLTAELSEFRPQLIYVRVVEHLYPYLVLAESLSRKLGIPVVTHVMDDYELPLAYSPVWYDRVVRRRLLHGDLGRLFRLSSMNFAISERMCEAFSRRYGASFECVHNGIDPAQWPARQDAETRARLFGAEPGAFKLLMAGSIDDKKDAGVVSTVAEVVGDLNQSGDLHCSLLLNVPDYAWGRARELAARFAGVRAQRYRALDNYRCLLASADCLVLARNFDAVSKAYTALSFHNKLPEYMISGTPILCIAPAWDGSAGLLAAGDAGWVLSNADRNAIREKIVEMARDPEKSSRYALNARNMAVAEFHIIGIRRRFEQRLREVATT